VNSSLLDFKAIGKFFESGEPLPTEMDEEREEEATAEGVLNSR
jgi:hypothetical protein